MMLFWKECKKTIGSLTFLLYMAAVLIMYASQFMPEAAAPLVPPQPDEVYEMREKEAPEVLMPAAIEGLLGEYREGHYTAYPFGLYKSVQLKENDNMKMAAILEELTGLVRENFDDFTEYEPGQVSYERFRELMEQADEIIGGGSRYSKRYLLTNFSQIPMTYEEALAEYEESVDERNLAETYIRLYCDYMGIGLAIFPVFVCAGFWQADRKSRMEQLVYTRKISSVRLILTRYLAMVCCMAVPVILTLLHVLFCMGRLYPEKNIFFGRAVMLALMWLLPELMAVSGLGVLLSEVFSPLLSIFVQGIWWYAAIEAVRLSGDITKYTLVIRHNLLGGTALFRAQTDDFLQNRIGYIVLACLLTGLVMLIYDQKRSGKFTWIKYLVGKEVHMAAKRTHSAEKEREHYGR